MSEIYGGYYAMVQFCADTARGELANVGIALV
ncbi:hypothetical protein FHT76_001379 [Rhizobium sp. BK176]|nr:hypothetical protein [Rhizobium sp. BK176]